MWMVSKTQVSQKTPLTNNIQGMDTPRSISYKTPTTVMDTPEARNESNSESDSDSVVETEHGGGKTRAAPMLAWRGHTRSDLLAMRNTAQVFLEEGRSLDAENLLLEAREGLSHVLGSTSEDTNRVGYQLAELYAKSGRMRESDQVIEDMTQTHIQALGYKDKRAQQHVLHCVELLNAWNRTEDALAFLNRSWELSQTDEAAEHDHSHDKQQTGALQKQKPTKGKPNSGKEPLQAVAQSVNAASNPAQIDFALAVAQSHSELKDKFAEMLLLQITQICEQRPFHLPIQTLRARSELLKLYIRKNTVNNNAAAFENSKNVFLQVWDCYDWDAEKFESITVMEAALQLAADIHKGGGFDLIAASIFRQVEQRATHLYGFEDERTIWILITVGLVYQRYAGWDAAREWFEQAFLGALANPSWGKGDGIVRSLQNAMDKKHFSYLSDEGRPFKTIFGVSGITIRPGRLHLE
jgi:hypothetical protein